MTCAKCVGLDRTFADTCFKICTHRRDSCVAFSPKEMSFHIIDLEQWEQRRCFHNLVRLANWEDSVPLI